jgi:hypothetical protein
MKKRKEGKKGKEKEGMKNYERFLTISKYFQKLSDFFT